MFFDCKLVNKIWFFLKNFDFSRIFLLSLREIEEGISEIFVCFPFCRMLGLEVFVYLDSVLLN